MKIRRIDHVGIVVNDLSAAKAFFLDLGFTLKSEGPVEGAWVDRVNGLKGTKLEIAMVEAPNGQLNLELTKFHSPYDTKSSQNLPANTLGLRHIAFIVEDIEKVVDTLHKKGMDLIGKIETAEYEGIHYKLCYIHGPEGLIVELGEQL